MYFLCFLNWQPKDTRLKNAELKFSHISLPPCSVLISLFERIKSSTCCFFLISKNYQRLIEMLRKEYLHFTVEFSFLRISKPFVCTFLKMHEVTLWHRLAHVLLERRGNQIHALELYQPSPKCTFPEF